MGEVQPRVPARHPLSQRALGLGQVTGNPDIPGIAAKLTATKLPTVVMAYGCHEVCVASSVGTFIIRMGHTPHPNYFFFRAD